MSCFWRVWRLTWRLFNYQFYHCIESFDNEEIFASWHVWRGRPPTFPIACFSDARALSEEPAIGEIRNWAWRMCAASSFSGELSQGDFVGAILTQSPARRALEHKPTALRLGSPPLRTCHQENRAIGLSASAWRDAAVCLNHKSWKHSGIYYDWTYNIHLWEY